MHSVFESRCNFNRAIQVMKYNLMQIGCAQNLYFTICSHKTHCKVFENTNHFRQRSLDFGSDASFVSHKKSPCKTFKNTNHLI